MKNIKKGLWKQIRKEVNYYDAITFFNGVIEGVSLTFEHENYGKSRETLIKKRELRKQAKKFVNIYDFSPKGRFLVKKFGIDADYSRLHLALKTKVKKLKKLKDIEELNEYLAEAEKSELLKEIDNSENGWGISKILSKYYNKDIKLDFGLNKPNITKQLDKIDIVPTQRESQAIDELLKLMENMKTALYPLDDTDLPYSYGERLVWALAGSCHKPNNVGEYTPFALHAMDDFFMLKFNDKDDLPALRIYYRDTVDDHLGHAGLYAESSLSEYNHTSYQAASMLLCVFVDNKKKVDDFSKVDGIPEEALPHNTANIWCNMHEKADYQNYGTVSNIFSELNSLDEDMFCSDTGITLYYDGWGWTDETVICENCEECCPENNAVYSPRMDAYFCSTDCLLEYALN